MKAIRHAKEILLKPISIDAVLGFWSSFSSLYERLFAERDFVTIDIRASGVQALNYRVGAEHRTLNWNDDCKLFGTPEENEIAIFHSCTRSIFLQIQADSVLSIDVRVAEDRSYQIKSFINDNFCLWSPYSLDDVYMMRRLDAKKAKLSIDYVPKNVVDALLAQLKPSKFSIDGIILTYLGNEIIYFNPLKPKIKWLVRNEKKIAAAATALAVGFCVNAVFSYVDRIDNRYRQEIAYWTRQLITNSAPEARLLVSLSAKIKRPEQSMLSKPSHAIGHLLLHLPPDVAVNSIVFSESDVTVTVSRDLAAATLSALETAKAFRVVKPVSSGTGINDVVITASRRP